MDKKPCLLTTYVAGEKYQAFIPLLVFSCKRAYPEYDIMLFLHEELSDDIKEVLQRTGLYERVVIRENVFKEECPQITALQAMSYRWVLWDNSFREYEYLYIVDIDIFYIREPQPLHIQHAKRMEMNGLPFDNLRRYKKIHKSLKGLIRRVQTAGFSYLPIFIAKKNIKEERLSGLHFTEVNTFYSERNMKVIEEIKKGISKRFFFPEILTSDNEVLLANMIKRMGYDISCLGVQTDNVKQLSFDDIYRKEFRPHHGFHLGIFRDGDVENKYTHSTAILQSDTYKYYLSQYKFIVKEGCFREMYQNLPSLAKTYIDRLHAYYQIDYSNE